MKGRLRVETALGTVLLGFNARGVTSLSFPAQRAHRDGYGRDDTTKVPGYDNALRAADLLKRYFSGEKVDFSGVRVCLDGYSPFFRRVCKVVIKIPYGTVSSYRDIAIKAGNPGAARAVGRVMALNPVPIIVPCHRVVTAEGRLGGYSAAGGTKTKEALLRMEGVVIGEDSKVKKS